MDSSVIQQRITKKLICNSDSEPSLHFRKANTEPSVHFRSANTESYQKQNVNQSQRVGKDGDFLRLSGLLLGISLGIRPREIPRSSPASPWKTPSFPPLLLRSTQYINSYQFTAIHKLLINLHNTRGKNQPIYFYCGHWLKVEQVTKPGNSFVVFGQSLCAMSVLGSQVFG